MCNSVLLCCWRAMKRRNFQYKETKSADSWHLHNATYIALCDRGSPAVTEKPAWCQFVFTVIRATQPQVWNTRKLCWCTLHRTLTRKLRNLQLCDSALNKVCTDFPATTRAQTVNQHYSLSSTTASPCNRVFSDKYPLLYPWFLVVSPSPSYFLSPCTCTACDVTVRTYYRANSSRCGIGLYAMSLPIYSQLSSQAYFSVIDNVNFTKNENQND